MSEEGGRTNPKNLLEEKFDTTHNIDFAKEDNSLFPVKVDTFRNMVFVNVDGLAPPLMDYLGDLPHQLAEYEVLEDPSQFVSVHSASYEVNANWKLLCENFLEYYHLPSVHPDLCKVSVVDNHKRTQGDGSYIGFVTHPMGHGGTPVDANVLPAYPGLTGDNLETCHFAVVFPNVFYFLLPHSMFTVTVMPDEEDPTKSVEYADLSVHVSALEDPDAEQKLKAMFDFYDSVNKEDIEVVERVQKGLQVYEYTGGRMAFRFEETIHRFQNMVADHMIGWRRVPFGDAKRTPGEAAFVGKRGELSREESY
jgi:choline monooxygenase